MSTERSARASRSEQPSVCLREARLSYGAFTALNATIRMFPGERVALVGPSGAGKSSMLSLIGGWRPATAGEVEVFGESWARMTHRQERQARSRIAAVHQSLNLVGALSVFTNVSAGRLGRWSNARALASLLVPQEREPVMQALDALGIAHLARARTDTLSGGEQQRVALARALVQEPSIVVADEPIAALDEARARSVMTLLTGTLGDATRTLVVSLHDFEIALEFCTRIVGIRGGSILFDLPTTQVGAKERQALYANEL